MNIHEQPLRIRLLFALGILMVTGPFLINDYIRIPDFFRGLLAGCGLALEVFGLIKIRQSNKTGTSC